MVDHLHAVNDACSSTLPPHSWMQAPDVTVACSDVDAVRADQRLLCKIVSSWICCSISSDGKCSHHQHGSNVKQPQKQSSRCSPCA